MRLSCFVLLLGGLASSACGLGHSDVAAESPGASAAVDAAPAGPCPAGPPAAGSSCPSSFVGLCEYGADPDYICNELFQCSGGTWSLAPPAATNAAGAACPTPHDAACPASEADVTSGAACSAAMTCGYADGICDCMNPPLPEVGARSWFCNEADRTCPSPRPHVGGACTSDGQTCDYGACTLPEGVTLECTDGTWQPTTMACPL